MNPPLPASLRPEFDRAVDQFGLMRYREKLYQLTDLAYLLQPIKGKPALGASKLGGAPDLPRGVDWPHTEDGRLVFVAQINLAELPQLDSILPRQGLLSFFIGTDEPARNIFNRVLYLEKTSSLRRLKIPSDNDYVSGCLSDQFDLRAFGESALNFKPVAWLEPFPNDPQLKSVSGLDGPISKLSEFLRGNSTESEYSIILGPTETCQGSPARDATLIANGYEDILYDWHLSAEKFTQQIEEASHDGRTAYAESLIAKRPLHARYLAEKAGLQDEEMRWCNLLVVGSHSNLDMCWWDAGTLNFLAHRDHISRKDFTKTYACIESS